MGIEVKNLTKTYKVKKHSNVDEVARETLINSSIS